MKEYCDEADWDDSSEQLSEELSDSGDFSRDLDILETFVEDSTRGEHDAVGDFLSQGGGNRHATGQRVPPCRSYVRQNVVVAF